jgi:hypothetical protein
VLDDVIVPGDDPNAERALVRRVVRAVDAEYVVAIDPRPVAPGGLVQLPRQGPVLTWRALGQADMPPRRDWHLCLGDIELF